MSFDRAGVCRGNEDVGVAGSGAGAGAVPFDRGRPLDVTRLLVTAEVVVGAVLVARELRRRPAAARATVTMGPGGWVSLKGGAMTVRPAERGWHQVRSVAGKADSSSERPWWARMLSAVSLQSLCGS